MPPPTAPLLRPWLLGVRLFAQAAPRPIGLQPPHLGLQPPTPPRGCSLPHLGLPPVRLLCLQAALLLSCAALPAAAAVPPLCAPAALSERLRAILSGCAAAEGASPPAEGASPPAASPLVTALVPAVAALEEALAAAVPGTPVPGTPVPGTPVPGTPVPGAVWALPPAPLLAVRAALRRHAPLLGGAEAERAAAAAAAAGVLLGCAARVRLAEGGAPNSEAQPHGGGGRGASGLRLRLCAELAHTPPAARAECLLQAGSPHGLS